MKTILVQVGKSTNKLFAEATADYTERTNHYMPFETLTIPELKNTRNISHEQQKQAEGLLIMKHLQAADWVVLLDERGKTMSSTAFARWIEQKQLSGRRLLFVIGGPYGFSEDVYQRADELLSLSAMTFSHQMVRLVFAEQMYRACTIIKGEQYHHE